MRGGIGRGQKPVGGADAEQEPLGIYLDHGRVHCHHRVEPERLGTPVGHGAHSIGENPQTHHLEPGLRHVNKRMRGREVAQWRIEPSSTSNVHGLEKSLERVATGLGRGIGQVGPHRVYPQHSRRLQVGRSGHELWPLGSGGPISVETGVDFELNNGGDPRSMGGNIVQLTLGGHP